MARKKKHVLLTDEEYDKLIAEVRRPKSDKEKRWIKLGWQILEAKHRYYNLDAPELSDYDYDLMEREYDTLSKELGFEPSAANMVGFNNTKPSAVLAADKVDGRMPPNDPT
jgi:hypothetical protein